MNTRKNLQNLFPFIYSIMIAGVLLICLFFRNVNYARKVLNYLPTIIMICVGLVLIYGINSLIKNYRRARPFNRKIFAGISIALLFVQIWAVYNYYFFTDWDVHHLIELATAMANGKNCSKFEDYFSQYPNNLFLSWIFSLILKGASLLNLPGDHYFTILCFQCVLSNLTGVLFGAVLNDLFHDVIIIITGYTLYVLLIGTSPWVSIPYSDSTGLIFPIMILYIYIKGKGRKIRWLPWLLIGILSIIGYRIKPQILILLIAIICIELLDLFRTGISKQFFSSLFGLTIGIVAAFVLTNVAIASIPLQINSEKSFGVNHFFMMGMNPKDMGVWSEDDVRFSKQFTTAAERNQENMKVAKERLHQMGITGISKQLVRKTLTNYNDGTFCWAGEGKFYVKMRPQINNVFSTFMKSLYYSRSQSATGKYYVVWSNFVQMIWQSILFLSIFCPFICRKNKNKNVIVLALIGLTIFELIFEARARYLYIYAPLYILLAMYGFQFLFAHKDLVFKTN